MDDQEQAEPVKPPKRTLKDRSEAQREQTRRALAILAERRAQQKAARASAEQEPEVTAPVPVSAQKPKQSARVAVPEPEAVSAPVQVREPKPVQSGLTLDDIDKLLDRKLAGLRPEPRQSHAAPAPTQPRGKLTHQQLLEQLYG